MTLKKKIEDNAIIFILTVTISSFSAGVYVHREYLNIAKSELLVENTSLKDKLKQNEARIKELLELSDKKTQDFDKRLTEMSSQLAAQKDQYESQIRKNRKISSAIQNQSKSQSRESGQSRKELEKNETKNIRQMPAAQADNFIFEATKCTRKGRVIYLEIKITNGNIAEEGLIVTASGSPHAYGAYEGDAAPSYLFDTRGIRYLATYVQFGNQSARDQAEQKLVPGVSVIANLVFENIQTDTDKVTIQLAAIHTRLLFPNKFYVVLRDIPLELSPGSQ